MLKTPSQLILDCAPVEKLSERVYQLFGRQALDELMEIPPNEGPVRSAITEPQLEADEQAATLRVSGFASRPESAAHRIATESTFSSTGGWCATACCCTRFTRRIAT